MLTPKSLCAIYLFDKIELHLCHVCWSQWQFLDAVYLRWLSWRWNGTGRAHRADGGGRSHHDKEDRIYGQMKEGVEEQKNWDLGRGQKLSLCGEAWLDWQVRWWSNLTELFKCKKKKKEQNKMNQDKQKDLQFLSLSQEEASGREWLKCWVRYTAGDELMRIKIHGRSFLSVFSAKSTWKVRLFFF